MEILDPHLTALSAQPNIFQSHPYHATLVLLIGKTDKEDLVLGNPRLFTSGGSLSHSSHGKSHWHIGKF